MDGNESKTSQRKSLFERPIELILVVVIIFSITFGMVYPKARQRSLIARTQYEMANLISAIGLYQIAYGRLPLPSNLSTNSPSDFTFGTFGTSAVAIGITNATDYQANNSDIMAILLDLTKFPNGKDTVNKDHSRNPQQTPFINVTMSSGTNSPGLGVDGVYRDPWGNPYIITFDLNHDKRSRDTFYRLASVSEIDMANTNGLNRLFRSSPPPYNSPETRDSFEAGTTIMIWSLGPDGKADASVKGDQGVNKDNVLSW